VIELRFAADDLLRVRFAVSPLLEAARALRTLSDPGAHAIHLPWMAGARDALAGLDLALLQALTADPDYVPDFVAPPPETPLPALTDELARVRSTSADQVALEVGWAFEGRELPDVVRSLLRDPVRTLDALATTLEEVHRRVIEPHWPRLRAVLDGDVLHRSRRLGEAGIAGMLDDIHPLVRVEGDRIRIAKPHQSSSDLAGRGLVLVPCAFSWPDVGVVYDRPWQPTLIYPPRGLALLWARGAEPPDEALAAVVGSARARILEDLDAPRSTTELANRLAFSPGGVSTHLAALRGAGLVVGHRTGRVVLYARSELGTGLIGATSRNRGDRPIAEGGRPR
jgi:DNA-binding transcriptional ArsR family regulator